ncbi:proteasome maturation factor UMP1 domain-containing protein [Ditylenchus destructor]|nr:proteasome maturation factor UMP1 domain-containing protein [Ditylenchus destructor]
MANILKLSKRPVDLLAESDDSDMSKKPIVAAFEKRENQLVVHKTIEDAPQPSKEENVAAHPLISEQSKRMPNIESLVEMRRKIGGNAQAEKLIQELASAGQFNRGPHGFSNSSRLHFDMLLNRDDKIDFGDYLNYNNDEVV